MFDEKDLIIDARHITRRFPAAGGKELTACNDINLQLYRGKTLGLVGESGCGKSTFMRFLVSLDKPTEGEILFNGKDITKLKGEELRLHRQHIQMVFQDPTNSFNPKMKIRDIICEPLLNFKKIRPSEKDAVARKYLEMVDLPGDFADRYPHNMSGGQRQRVAIARAIVLDPEVIIMDEATSALDAKTESEVVDAIKNRGITCIVVAHRLSTIRDCDEIIVMEYGKVVERGTHDELYAKGGIYTSLVSNE